MTEGPKVKEPEAELNLGVPAPKVNNYQIEEDPVVVEAGLEKVYGEKFMRRVIKSSPSSKTSSQKK